MAALAVVKGLKEKRAGAKSDQAIILILISSYLSPYSYSYFYSYSYEEWPGNNHTHIVTDQAILIIVPSCCQNIISSIFLFSDILVFSLPYIQISSFSHILISSTRLFAESWTFSTTITTTRSGWRTSLTSWMSTTLSSTLRRYLEAMWQGFKPVSQKSGLLPYYLPPLHTCFHLDLKSYKGAWAVRADRSNRRDLPLNLDHLHQECQGVETSREAGQWEERSYNGRIKRWITETMEEISKKTTIKTNLGWFGVEMPVWCQANF